MNDTIRFEVRTRYDEAAYRALVCLMIGRLRRWPRRVVLLTGFTAVIVSAWIMIASGDASILAFAVLLTGNLTCMFGLFAPRIALRMMMASNRKGDTPLFEYRFSDGEMRVRAQDREHSYTYAFIRKVLEMSGYLFFFTGDRQVYLLNIRDISGNYRTFRSFLDERLQASRAVRPEAAA